MVLSKVKRLKQSYHEDVRFFKRSGWQVDYENLQTLCFLSTATVVLLFVVMLANFFLYPTLTTDIAYTIILMVQIAICLVVNLAGNRLLGIYGAVQMMVRLYTLSMHVFLIFISLTGLSERAGVFVAIGVLALQLPFFMPRLEAPLATFVMGTVYLVLCRWLKSYDLFRFDVVTVAISWFVGLMLGDDYYRLRMLDHQHRTQLNTMSSRDRLTGLYTRSMLDEQIGERLKNARETDHYALIIVRMFGLRRVNELYGRDTGDRLLNEAGKIVMEKLDLTDHEGFRDEDSSALAGRTDGNEIVLFLSTVHTHAQAERRALEICALIEEIPASDDGRQALHCEAGFAIYPKDGTSYATLYRHAEDGFSDGPI